MNATEQLAAFASEMRVHANAGNPGHTARLLLQWAHGLELLALTPAPECAPPVGQDAVARQVGDSHFDEWFASNLGRQAATDVGRKQKAREAYEAGLLAAAPPVGRDAVPARYFASGPEGHFFTDSLDFAEAVIRKGTHPDDWTVTDLGATPAAVVSVNEAMVFRGARELCRLSAEQCGVDFEDNWKTYSREFMDDARTAITAALTDKGAA